MLLKAYENATHTVMRFVRNLDTCDPLQDVRIVNDTMRLIVIYHAEQPRNGRVRLPGALSDSQMAIRAVVPLQLSGRTRKPLRPPANRVQTIDVLSRAVPMPRLPGERGDGATTLEWCRMLELNQFKQKHHMIGFQPVFASARARKQLDAIVLYECAGAASALTAAERSGGAVCALWRQTHAVVCEAVVASWTRGSAVSVVGFCEMRTGFLCTATLVPMTQQPTSQLPVSCPFCGHNRIIGYRHLLNFFITFFRYILICYIFTFVMIILALMSCEIKSALIMISAFAIGTVYHQRLCPTAA